MTDTVIEKKYPPQWVVDRLTNLGGLNPYGLPNYRVIWGGNRTHLVGGMFKKPMEVATDSMIIGEPRTRTIVLEVAEMRTLLKYHPFRWHLEKWCGPEVYGSREDWYINSWDEVSQLHTMGDYPSEGDYEHVFFLAMCSHMQPRDTDWCQMCQLQLGEFIPLEENIHIIERQIQALKMTEGVSKDEEKRALFLRESDKRQVRRKIVEERVREAMRPTLATQPTSWQDGSRCSVPEAKMTAPLLLPKSRLGFSQSDHAMPSKKQQELDNN